MFKNRIVKGNFNWSARPIDKKESVVVHDTPGGRYYEVSPGIYYPSITTVLSESVDLSWWVEKMGVEESNRIKNTAASRGTQMHDLIERYLANKEIPLNEEMPTIKTSFLGGRHILDKIDHILFQETVLWSNQLKVAGRMDVAGTFEGISSIIDFKTSNKPKEKDYIGNYFCQTTAYREMLRERYGMNLKQIVIIIFVDGQTEPQVFRETPERYIGVLENKIQNFKGKFNDTFTEQSA